MESLFTTSITGLHRFDKQEIKDAEHADHIEHISHVENAQIHDIHLPHLDTHEKRPSESRASLLTLPVELRLRIYEMAYNATYIHSKLEWEGGLRLFFDGSSSSIRLAGSPFTLPRVCRRLYMEVSPMLPPISHVCMHFSNFSQKDMHAWLELLSDVQIAQARSFKITGWVRCRLDNPLYANGHYIRCQRYRINSNYPIACTESCSDRGDESWEYVVQCLDDNFGPALTSPFRAAAQAKKGLCDRSLTLDLNAFERQFQSERFARMMNQPGFDFVDQTSHREFHKACYLLRVLDGCVDRPAPRSHPAGKRTQCGTMDDVEAAVASFVSDEGSVIVTRESITQLLEVVVGGGGSN